MCAWKEVGDINKLGSGLIVGGMYSIGILIRVGTMVRGEEYLIKR